ncbi:MAG TPA: hypothetical protein VMZ91_14510 [Candidatus Paceibacterota bacterium]|nr:hypothetical protein [Candidatus Paceibacterota bacterium]
MKFEIDHKQIKIAATEESISKTIEELLSLNDRIPKQTGKEIIEVTEKQLSNSKKNDTKSHNPEEVMKTTESQFEDRQDEDSSILEVRLEEAKPTDLGHNSDMWDMDEIEVRGHFAVPPIWHSVYKKEDERKKLDKGQLNRKIN